MALIAGIHRRSRYSWEAWFPAWVEDDRRHPWRHFGGARLAVDAREDGQVGLLLGLRADARARGETEEGMGQAHLG